MVHAGSAVSGNISGLEVLASSIDTDFNYVITNALELPLSPSPLTFRLQKFVRGFPN